MADHGTTTDVRREVGDLLIEQVANQAYPRRAWTFISMDAPDSDDPNAEVTMGMLARRGLTTRSALELCVMLLESQGFTVTATDEDVVDGG